MEFEVFSCRTNGVLRPRHVMWSTQIRGDLYVEEKFDAELSRTVKVATIRSNEHAVVRQLHDVVLVSAKPDWWTMTGWERIEGGAGIKAVAFQQSWILIPSDKA